MAITMDQIKALREETGAGVMDAKKALEESNGNVEKAKEWINKKGMARAEKKADREAGNGLVASYIHHDGRSGALIILNCETDFVARTDDFKNLAKEMAMQITSNDPESVEEFLAQPYNRNPKQTIEELMKTVSGKLGEKIELKEFTRYKI